MQNLHLMQMIWIRVATSLFRGFLIFFSDFMLCLIILLRQIVHICISCFNAGCCQCYLLDLSDFLYAHFRFCCFLPPRFCIMSCSWPVISSIPGGPKISIPTLAAETDISISCLLYTSDAADE